MAHLTVQHKQGSTYEAILDGTWPTKTTIRRKYETWLVPHRNELLEVNNLDEVGRAIAGYSLAVKLVR
ncbi:MAG: hypothetical protein R3321_05740 [Nitrososphaeraceae archaeon]|nr:hypothetical protein [Nitrososphaeraceae archaeon]